MMKILIENTLNVHAGSLRALSPSLLKPFFQYLPIYFVCFHSFLFYFYIYLNSKFLYILTFYIASKRCESHGPGSFAPGRKDPRLLLQYFWIGVINRCNFSPDNFILRGIRYDIQRSDFRDIEEQILDPCVPAQKILDREIHTDIRDMLWILNKKLF